ncbi:HAM1 protein [Giardia muris]|uniref:Inosine triphosphate pyrophosphatase n=1 Tax=Giardia muris TaxID=5742 RepID=A0A4Z1T536_GIAMU|nr:HAM1 protein [Giardia muris]|eukprot:TNJ27561.1 HAM1 protein [Giardia muris]
MSSPICFVTSSGRKLEEFRSCVGDETIIHRAIDLPEYQGTPEFVAREKALTASRIYNGPVLVDDTSLCFNAYGGLPGVYVKHFLQAVGAVGLYHMLDAYEDKTGYAQAVIAFCDVNSEKYREPVLFIGRCEGRIVEPRGSMDLCWDSIFEPFEGGGKTFGEMALAEKNRISHRGRALAKTSAFLAQLRTNQ